MSPFSASQSVPEGPGSVSGAPNLPAGFTDTFTSRYIDTGEVRLHAVIGGDGPPLLLVHGWPETWYAWRMVMPALARDFAVIAVDQRGIGLSDKPAGRVRHRHPRQRPGRADGCARPRAIRRWTGHDTGLPIGYALAADHPDRVERVALAEIPGLPARLPRRRCSFPRRSTTGSGTCRSTSSTRSTSSSSAGARTSSSAASSTSGRRDKLPDDVVEYYVGARLATPTRCAAASGSTGRSTTTHRAERAAQDPAADHARPGDRRSGELRGARRRTR